MSLRLSRTTLALSAIATIGFGMGIASFTRVQAAPTVAAPCAVAVVNVRQVMRTIKEYAALQELLRGKKEDAEKGLETKRKALENLKNSAKLLEVGSPAWLAKQDQFTELSVQLEGDQKIQEDRLGRQANAAELNLYRKVCLRAGKLAEDKGYDLLLDQTVTPEALNTVPTSPKAVEHYLFGERELLWAKKSVNLTEDLIAAMNNDFNQRSSAPAVSTPNPASPVGPIAPSAIGTTVPAPAK